MPGMDEQGVSIAEEPAAQRGGVGRGGQIVAWMLLAGVMAVGVGALGLATAFTIERIMDEDSGFSISDAASLFATSAAGSSFMLLVHVTLLGMLVFLPVRYAWKRPIAAGWTTGLSAFAGGILASLPWLIRWFLEIISDMTTLSSEVARGDDWIMPAVYATAGCIVGGVFGYTYAVIERRSGGLPGSSPAVVGEKVADTNSETKIARISGISSSSSAWVLAGLLLMLAGLMIWLFTTPTRMVASARRAAVKHQAAVVAEARKMLEEAETAENGVVAYGYSAEQALPEAFANMGDVSASTGQRLPGVVKVQVTSGFTHFGLFIVPEPTSATVPMLRDAVVREDYGSLTIVNDQVYQYSEGY